MINDSAQSPALLRNSTLAHLAASITRPRYDRSRMFPGLVHIGVGGFNRSHLAVYLDDLLLRGESKPWSEFGIGLLPPDKLIHSALVEQDSNSRRLPTQKRPRVSKRIVDTRVGFQD